MALSGLSLLTVADRGWTDKRELRVANVSASWQVNATGTLSAILSSREAWLLGIDDYLGKWVRWDHPTMGSWGGRIIHTPVNLGAGTVELTCEGFTTLLKKRRTRKTQKPSTAPAGSLVLRAMSDLAVNDLPFDDIACDTGGDPVTLRWNADDLFSVVSNLARAVNYQFDVVVDDDNLLTFLFRAQVGEDRTGDVVLYEGYQIADGSINTSIANLVNDRLAVSAEGNWDDAASIAVTDGPSAQQYGQAQDTQRYYGFTTGQALATRAKVDLATISVPSIPMSFKMSDRAPELAEVRQGDTIRVRSASANRQYIMRVIGRAVDAETGFATIAGTAEVEE